MATSHSACLWQEGGSQLQGGCKKKGKDVFSVVESLITFHMELLNWDVERLALILF